MQPMNLLIEQNLQSEAMMHSHMISNAASLEAAHYQAIAQADIRENAMETMKNLVLAELDQGEPATCDAFSEFCADRVKYDLTYQLCLSRIHQDDTLLQLALQELKEHVDDCRSAFCDAEVERRIAKAKEDADAEAAARLENGHV